MSRGPNPREIILSEEEANELARLIRRHNAPQQSVLRARIIQVCETGMNNAQVSGELGIHVKTVRLWRNRWADLQHIPLEEYNVEARLSDAPRSGSPGKFSAEQVTQIIAIACEEPEANGYPVSHWTPKEIVMEAVKRHVVSSISERQVGRFLKRGGLKAPSNSLLDDHN